MTRSPFHRALLLSLATGLATGLLPSTPAYSQAATGDEPPAQEETEEKVFLLEPLEITGRKREEKLSDAPVSATILDEEDVPPSSLDAGAEIARQSPNTNFVDYSRFGEAFMNMRGVATLGSPINALDSTIGFSTDGVPTTISGFAPILLDVERIEVFRGPQGTTFGRNALGGAVNVVHRKADGEKEYRLTTEVGTDGHAFVENAIGGWIFPGAVAGRAAVRFQKYDGDIHNGILNRKVGGAEIGAARGTFRVTPDETLTIDMTGSYSRDERWNPAYILKNSASYPTSGEDVLPQNLRTIAQGIVNVAKDWKDFTFTSLTSLQDIDIWNYGDFTDTYILSQIVPLPALWTNPATDKVGTDEKERIFTQEFRLNSPAEDLLEWVAGVNYFRSDYELHRDANNNPLVGGSFNGTWDNEVKSETWAVFADATLPVSDFWDVNGGLRFARDTQNLDAHYVGNIPVITVPSHDQNSDFSDNYLSGHGGFTYHWTDDILSYVSVSRGYASGGFEKATPFAAQGATTPPFLPAKSWTYEAGTKAMFGSVAHVNIATFYNDVKDGQLTAFDTTTLQVYVASQDFNSYGFEVSGAVMPIRGIAFTGSAGYTESEMTDVNSTSAAAGAMEGNQVPQVPNWTATIGVNMFLPGDKLGLPGEFYLRAEEQYVGERYSDLANTQTLDDYHMVNARIGWNIDHFGVYVFGNNLLDDRPVAFQFDYVPGVTAAYVGRGQLLGVGASVQW